jgi:hypothetical protein
MHPMEAEAPAVRGGVILRTGKLRGGHLFSLAFPIPGQELFDAAGGMISDHAGMTAGAGEPRILAHCGLSPLSDTRAG